MRRSRRLKHALPLVGLMGVTQSLGGGRGALAAVAASRPPTADPAAADLPPGRVSASEVLDRGFRQVFGSTSTSGQRRGSRKRGLFSTAYSPTSTTAFSTSTSQQRERRVEDMGDDAVGANDGYDDDENQADELCSQYLVSFLEGTTDAKDTCEGIMNAYTAADCSAGDEQYAEQNGVDDYFEEFYEHTCCQSLMQHHNDYCEESNLLSNMHLLVAISVLLLCECAKVLVKKQDIHFLPEAAVCILVGTVVGLLAHLLPGTSIDEMVFDEDLFMSVLLPPIIFEAALSVSKSQFKRRRGAIFNFAVLGTIISTFSTGFMVHYVSKYSKSTTFPVLDSLVFGALISSIDPVAILSVLTSLNLCQTDTVFILVFGESLLNDGIAITVFKTLVARFDGKTNDGTTSVDEILGAIANFLLAMFGSIAIGITCGCGAWVYFYLLERNLHPVMEVGSFFLWALVPYYISEGLEWSGIVAIVAMAFIMDIYIAAPKKRSKSDAPSHAGTEASDHSDEYYVDMDDGVKSFATGQSIQPISRTERIRLSATADKHVRFVAHLTAQLSENAIFAYLGLFLLSNNYNWDPTLVSIAVMACVVCRALMVIVVCSFIWHIYRCRGRALSKNQQNSLTSVASQTKFPMSRTAAAIQDRRTQVVLVLAGLRGAVSLALVENVPIYNSVTGEGCEFKPLMKAMTSASIIFTTFVFGGGAYYILPHLGITPDRSEGIDATFHAHVRRPGAHEIVSRSTDSAADPTMMCSGLASPCGDATNASPSRHTIRIPAIPEVT